MRPLRGSIWCCALAVLAVGSGTSYGAWDNVFQVCCHSCKNNTSNYQPIVPVAAAPQAACPQPACPQQCTTRYEQRSYYQPVTTYQTTTFYEPVTTYRTSYFWEPVTTYRYSCYFDPCTCSYKQVATPQTSYSLKSQCNPVTSYLERTACKPVTTQQLVTYYQPITTCCQTTMGAPVSTLPPGAVAVPGAGAVGAPGAGAVAVPAAGDQTGAPPLNNAPAAGDRTLPDGREQSRKIGSFDSSVPRSMPKANDSSSFRSPELKAPYTPASPTPPVAPPTARIDRIAMLPDCDVQGQVVTAASAPRAGARVLLVRKDQENVKQSVTADDKGLFHVRLEAGTWLAYVNGADGTPVYHDVLEVRASQQEHFVLTSR